MKCPVWFRCWGWFVVLSLGAVPEFLAVVLDRPVVTADDVRPVSDTTAAVQVFVNGDSAAGQCRSPAGFLNLQDPPPEVHGVVLVHGAFVL